MRNHTGTHLLHRALRNVVGERARQAGSLVTPDYLRFDFPFDRGLTVDELHAIEDEVHRIIREDRPVSIAFMSMAEAIEGGADAFFDEKYGETVRTIRVQDYSFELCGGTHARATGQIGGFLITARAEHRLRHAPHRGRHRARRRRARPRALRRPRAGGIGRRRPVGRWHRGPDRGAPGRAARDEATAQGGRRGRPPEARRAGRQRRPRSRPASGSSRPRSRSSRWMRSRRRPAT